MKEKFKKLLQTKEIMSLSGNFSVSIFRFLTFMLLARTYSPSIFGEWLLYLITSGLLEMLRFGITKISIIKFLSGARAEERQSLIGANWFLGLLLTIIIIIVLILIKQIFPNWVNQSGYILFFTWYPLLAIFNLPYNNAISVLQANQDFKSILFIRLVSKGGFFIFSLFNYLFFNLDIQSLIFAHLGINLLTSAICVIKKWDGMVFLIKATKRDIARLFHFGKFTIGTMIGSNLLKSADTMLIGFSSFGPAAVALYSVPLKLTEIMEIFLRSFLATAFPKMSKASAVEDNENVKKIFYTFSGAITLAFIPLITICVLFAKYFVLILGGSQYAGEWVPIVLFQIFAIYTLFLPIDRFTGVALDSINKPKRNFYKVMLMASLNITGDLIALYVFKSLIAVAFVTILFTIAGQVIGFRFLNREIPVNYRQIFVYGWRFYLDAWHSHVKPKIARP